MGLNNSQYNQILREYDAKQFAIKKTIDLRTKEVYKKINGFKELDDKIISNSMKCARLTLTNDDKEVSDAIEKLRNDNTDISMSKMELLIENGFPANYLEPEYECNDCKDTGFIDNKPCRCFTKAAIKQLYSQDLINKAISKENFSTFNYELYPNKPIYRSIGKSPYDNIISVVEHCQTFIKEFGLDYNKKTFKNLLICGDTGVGKTFLTNCIAKELLDKAYSVIYVSSSELFDILAKSSFEKDDNDALEKTEYIYDSDLLIIDDLGTELTNSFTSSQLYSCINNRMLKNLSTIISTNLTLDDIHTIYNERISSRLIGEYKGIQIIGNDNRRKTLKKQ